MTRERWLDVARRVANGQTEGLRCPENDDDLLMVEWISGPHPGEGEYRLYCPTYGAQNFLRKSGSVR